jgi:hypothetical protein
MRAPPRPGLVSILAAYGVSSAVLTGCTTTHDLPDVAFARDSASNVADTALDAAWIDTNMAPGMVACGGVWCARGESCCQLTSVCVAPGDATCAPPAGSPPGSCASNADCPSGETCQVLDARGGVLSNRCGGLGTCWRNDGGCGGSGAVCGCDGNTYPTLCDAYAAGARVVSVEGGCGQAMNQSIPNCVGTGTCTHGTCDPSTQACVPNDQVYLCATTAQCPTGQTCCAGNGVCYAPSDAAICATAPEGTLIACGDNTDCARWDGSYWGGPTLLFCNGPGCTGPGGCVSPNGSCDGTLAPVCGCDGRTYTNACEARLSSVRVAHVGGC